MRNRRIRRGFNQESETRKIVYVAIIFVIIAILTFVISYVIYSNTILNNSKNTELSKITDYSSMANEITYETSTSISKSVNEITNEENNNNKKDEEQDENLDKEKSEKKDDVKIAVNTSNIVKQYSKKNNNEKNENNDKKEVVPDPTFTKPVEGEIIREYAKDSLVYSETLKEWITHTGIDIKADKKSIVKASADGRVKSIKTDPRYGITVIIEHTNGFTSVYANLLTAEFVKENENVKQGQTIGTVGDTAAFEILDDSHLHFEILKNNEYLNPSDYIGS